MTKEDGVANNELLTLTADIVSSHVSNNAVAVADIPTLLRDVYMALSDLGAEPKAAEPKQEPAVSVRASVKPDYIICLEDGKKLKMLKRHLMTHYNMTPDEYRAKWKLPPDYPMVAPNYAEQRRKLANKIGLGRRTATAAGAMPAPEPFATVAKPAPASDHTATAEPGRKAPPARARKASRTTAAAAASAGALVTADQTATPAHSAEGLAATEKGANAAKPKRRKLGVVVPRA